MKSPRLLACLLIALLATPALAGWDALTTGVTKNLNASYFTSPTLGFTVGADGTVLKTTSGGATFDAAVVGTNTLNDTVFLSSQEGYLLGNAGALFKTTNGGTTFTPVTLPLALAAADFRRGSINGSAIAFAVYTAPDSYLYYSADGGASFTAALQAGFEIKGVTLTGDATWEWGVSGGNYVLLKNGTQVYSSGTTPINDLFFYDNNTGYAVGDSGLIVKTTTGGNAPGDWATLSSGSGAQLNSVYFIAQTIGWIVGNAGTALFTNDGGATFYRYTDSGLTASIDLNDIFIVTTLNGGSLVAHAYAAGTGGNIYKLMSPNVASAEPASRQQGWIGTVEVHGTDFLAGGSGAVAFSGSGLTVFSSMIDSATAASAFVISAPDAAPGARDVTVTNPDQTTGTSTGAFSILPNPGKIEIRNVWFNGNAYNQPPMDVFNPPTVTFEVFSSAATLDAAALHGRVLLKAGGVYTIWDIPASGVTLNGMNDAIVKFKISGLPAGPAALELYAEDTANNVSREALSVNVLPDSGNVSSNQQATAIVEGGKWNPSLGGAKLQIISQVNLSQGGKIVIGTPDIAAVINFPPPVTASSTGKAHFTVTINEKDFVASKMRANLAWIKIIDNSNGRVIGGGRLPIVPW